MKVPSSQMEAPDAHILSNSPTCLIMPNTYNLYYLIFVFWLVPIIFLSCCGPEIHKMLTLTVNCIRWSVPNRQKIEMWMRNEYKQSWWVPAQCRWWSFRRRSQMHAIVWGIVVLRRWCTWGGVGKDQKDVDDEVGAEDVGDLAETMGLKNLIIEEFIIIKYI